MDINCRFCGEPWEHETLHDIDGLSYSQAGKAFAKHGCNAMTYPRIDSPCTASPVVSADTLEAIAALQELSPHPEEWTGAEDMLEMSELMWGDL